MSFSKLASRWFGYRRWANGNSAESNSSETRSERPASDILGGRNSLPKPVSGYNRPARVGMDYHEFHGFSHAPFELSPDPGIFIMCGDHEDALDRLYRGIQSERGFLVLTGDVGTGKTLLLHTLLGLLGENYQIAYIFHSHLGSADLLELVLAEFGVAVPSGATQALLLKMITNFLIERRQEGIRPVLIIDEAQNLSPTTLEEMRVISNLETHEGKLLQFLLAGQNELNESLSSPALRQLKQRITVRASLSGLSATETSRYIHERCRIAGVANCPFSRQLILHIYALTLGIPRLINSVCDTLLLDSFLDGSGVITVELLHQVQRELEL